MEFLFGLFVGIVVIYFFMNPAKTRELETSIKSKLEEHKNERTKKD